MQNFTHLHTHTAHTTGNSTLEISDLVKRAKKWGMEATAIVDSGTIAGFGQFTAECRNQGIEPIYGCGLYLAKGSRRAPEGRSHLVLLACSKQGMANLTRLDDCAQSEGMLQGKAHIDDELLKIHSDGLICLTGGLGGDIDQLILAGNYDQAVNRAEFYHAIYGDRFYLELQNHGSQKNRAAIEGLTAISNQTGIPTLVSQGAFYLNKEDAEQCNELRRKNGNKPLTGREYYFRTAAEMHELFTAHPNALANTEHVAARCLQYSAP